MNEQYVNTVRLLLAIAPAVFQSPRFAMKGGTAINLFVQDLPRLSVDIDVVFIDCFVAYLAGHNRPVHEVLFPRKLPLDPTFSNEFAGMTREPIELGNLEGAQGRLIDELPRALTSTHREFLLALVRAEPQWDLMPFKHLPELPAMQWKLHNLQKPRSRNRMRFDEQHDALASKFEALGSVG